MKEGIDGIKVMLTPEQAQLLKAAPAMYEALKLWHSHQQGTRGHYCSECANALQDAIFKAEGRT